MSSNPYDRITINQVAEDFDGTQEPGTFDRETRENCHKGARRRADTNSNWEGDRCVDLDGGLSHGGDT